MCPSISAFEREYRDRILPQALTSGLKSTLMPTILIVDDDVAHARSVSALLAHYGLGANTLNQGSAAIAQLQAHHYDLLLLDLDIPDMSGLEVLNAMRAQDITTRTIILSGESSLDNVTPILRLGAFDFVRKPFEPEALVACVKRALDQTRLERENAEITARAEASNRLHRFLIEASPDLIYVLDEEGRFRLANNQLKEIFDLDAQSLKGKHWESMFTGSLQNDINHHFNERRTAERATRQLEIDYIDSQGKPRILELSAMGLYEEPAANTSGFAGTYGVLRDVTSGRQTARELADSQRKFQGLFKHSPDAAFICELDSGLILESNESFERIAQAIDDAIENTAKESHHVAHRTEVHKTDTNLWPSIELRKQFIADLRADGEQQVVDIEHSLMGETRYFHISGRLIDLEGQPAVLATLRDVTNEKRAQQDRLLLESQLQQASKMEAIGQLAGGIAHDFNNILASIIGYTELVQVSRDRLADETIESYLGEVVDAGKRARELISQMLTFTKAIRGDAQRVRVSDTIDEVSRMLRAAIPATIRIETTFDPATPPVLIDPVQLQQIVINLLINARDAIEQHGDVKVELQTSVIDSGDECASCEAALNGTWVELSVEDTGHGIDESMLRTIFDMYVTTREPGQGTGIGLWLIHTLVHEYGGHIRLSSEPGKGTRFGILLPDADAVSEPAAARVLVADLDVNGEVLVVDDDVSVSKYLAEVLRNANFNVRVFNDSAAAMLHLEQNVDRLSVLVTDQMMPQVSGLQLARRAKELRPTLPVILITGYTHTSDLQQAREMGLEGCLKKPFRMDELLNALQNVVGPDADSAARNAS